MVTLYLVVSLIVVLAVVLALGYARTPPHVAYRPRRPHLQHPELRETSHSEGGGRIEAPAAQPEEHARV